MVNRIILNETSYHGAGAIASITAELAQRGLKKPIVFTDPDLIKFGVSKKVTDILDKAKVKYAVYSDIKANPTIKNVKDGVKAFKAAKADSIIAIGGGSAMDTAKAVGIIIANPKFADVRSLEGVAPTKNPSKPILAVPTTAGTAAEVTINYVITDVEKKRKFVCVDPHDIPVVAFVDPEMMSSMPKGLTAFTGMDALTHAIEGYITKGACAITDMLHLEVCSQPYKSRKGPKYALFGVTGYTPFWGPHNSLLGWYADEASVQREIRAIREAMRRGDPDYTLQYNAKVRRRFGMIELKGE